MKLTLFIFPIKKLICKTWEKKMCFELLEKCSHRVIDCTKIDVCSTSGVLNFGHTWVKFPTYASMLNLLQAKELKVHETKSNKVEQTKKVKTRVANFFFYIYNNKVKFQLTKLYREFF